MNTQALAPADIMVIDDTPENLRLLLKILMDQGHRVRPMADGELAIAAAQQSPPDLILLDIKMPRIDGYEVCKQLKQSELTQNIPIIFLTVLDEAVDKVKGFAMGAVDFVSKPFETAELLARVENQLQLSYSKNQLREQEEFLRSIYGGLEAAVSVIDVLDSGHFRIKTVNDTFLRMSGLKREELEGADLRDFVTPEVIQRNHQACLDLGQAVTNEESVILHGQTTWWLSTHIPIRDRHGQFHRLIGTSLNITHRRQIEETLAQRSQELSKTLEALKETQDELIQSAKMASLGHLVAGVAHEINTPVGTALLAASTLNLESARIKQTLLSNAETSKIDAVLTHQLQQLMAEIQDYSDVAQECSGLILSNLQRAGELVQSFKQVAVDQTNLQVRSFNLKIYLQEVLLNLQPALKRTPHQIDCEGDDDIILESYPGAFSQVITNLVMNSIEHAYPRGDAGILKLSWTLEDEKIQLKYSDDGQGIEPDAIPKIFEPFFTTARHRGGSGLGLHTTYNLVNQTLQGSLLVNSRVKEGTEFVMTLPRSLKT